MSKMPMTPNERTGEMTDWDRLRSLSSDATEAAARLDLDNPPLDTQVLAAMPRLSRAKVIRRALGLTQEEFAQRYHIPLGTLRDWEQGRSFPDQPTQAYLRVIAMEPEATARALAGADAA